MTEPNHRNCEHLAAELASRLSEASVVRRAEPMSRRTTLRVGGNADIFIEPTSEPDLAAVLNFCRERAVPWLVVGRGSNLLVRDQGFRGAIIGLSQAAFCSLHVDGARISCGAGAKLKAVAILARQSSLAGVEFLEGIPGSVGGALRMNAGAMGAAIFDVVHSVRAMEPTGEIRTWGAGDLHASYRRCEVLADRIALRAELECVPGDTTVIERRMREFSQKRWQSQPAAPSAGCMFKNPPSIPAGKLIDELGLKGLRVGGAVVSDQHANFIINDDGATSNDVLQVIAAVKARALSERGIELETEVQVVGE